MASAEALVVDSVQMRGSCLQVPVDLQSIYRRTVDTSTAPLSAFGYRLGAFLYVEGLRRVLATVVADAPGELVWWESDDSVNWIEALRVPHGGRKRFEYASLRRFVRVDLATTEAQSSLVFEARVGVE